MTDELTTSELNKIKWRFSLEKVKLKHSCHKCRKILNKGDDRIRFSLTNYCMSCGYAEIQKEASQLNSIIAYLKKNYSVKIVTNALSKK